MYNYKILKENKILKQEALTALKGKWGIAVLVQIILMFVSIIVSRTFPPLSFVITSPLTVGAIMFYILISRGQLPNIGSIFNYFNNRFGTYIWAYVIVFVKTILWSLLFIIPGIIATLSYSQTFYILAEDNSISGNDAVNKSIKMMKGHKWQFFKLGLSFIGWIILGILTLCIGLIWVGVYIAVTKARFYDELKLNQDQTLSPQV